MSFDKCIQLFEGYDNHHRKHSRHLMEVLWRPLLASSSPQLLAPGNYWAAFCLCGAAPKKHFESGFFSFLLKKKTNGVKLPQGIAGHYQWFSGFPVFSYLGGGCTGDCEELWWAPAFISVPWWMAWNWHAEGSSSEHQSSPPGLIPQARKLAFHQPFLAFVL